MYIPYSLWREASHSVKGNKISGCLGFPHGHMGYVKKLKSVICGFRFSSGESWNMEKQFTRIHKASAFWGHVQGSECKLMPKERKYSWKTSLCNFMLPEVVAIVWGILAQLNGQYVENIYFPNHTKRMTHTHAQAVLLIDGLGRLCSCRYTSRSNSWSLQGMQSKWSWLR